MWEPFTETARQAIVFASEEAQSRSEIGAEDILLGILATDSAGAHALSAAGVKLEAARAVVREHRLHRSDHRETEEFRQEMLFSSGAKRVMERAFEQARQFNHNYIGTEHLLLGILEQNTNDQSPAISQICGDGVVIEAEVKRLVAVTPHESKKNRSVMPPAAEASPSMWEPFMEDARQTIVLAQEAAMRLDVAYIGSEHILLGIMAVGSGIGFEMLSAAGAQRVAVEAIVRTHSVKTKPDQIQYVFTPAAKKVIEAAFDAAFQMKQTHINTGDLLIALLDDEHIERIFDELHIDRARIRRSTIERLRSS